MSGPLILLPQFQLPSMQHGTVSPPLVFSEARVLVITLLASAVRQIQVSGIQQPLPTHLLEKTSIQSNRKL
jgi:hypothetical protein